MLTRPEKDTYLELCGSDLVGPLNVFNRTFFLGPISDLSPDFTNFLILSSGSRMYKRLFEYTYSMQVHLNAH